MSTRKQKQRWLAALALCGVLGGCVSNPFAPQPKYHLLSVDESMSCDAMGASFRFSAKRAARLEFWLGVGPVNGYQYERFPIDAPVQLRGEYQRLDALTDLQRTRGCPVFEPRGAVAAERAELEAAWQRTQRLPEPPPPPPVLRSRG